MKTIKKDKLVSVFYLGYILYFTALYFDDLSVSFGPVGKLLKYVSYAVMLVSVTGKHINTKRAVKALFLMVTLTLFAAFTRDLYYLFFGLIILSSKYYDIEKIFKISFILLLVLASLTVAMSLVGILPNVNTGNANFSQRYGFGFYHSNVLPMVLYYLMAYRMVIKSYSIKPAEIFIWCAAAVAVFTQCRSRNGFITVACLALGYFIYRKRTSYKLLYFAAKFSTAVISTLLLIFSLMQGLYLKSMYIINRFFTGRLAMAYHQMKVTGLHFINLRSKYDYGDEKYVLDSGYLYTIIHYGILFVFLYFVFQYCCAKNNKYNAIVLVVILVNVLANTIDNDLYSYNMLPFLLFAANGVNWGFSLKSPQAVKNIILNINKKSYVRRKNESDKIC